VAIGLAGTDSGFDREGLASVGHRIRTTDNDIATGCPSGDRLGTGERRTTNDSA
jgi:hypothetical protein